MERTINILHLYPDLLNLYGDRGNIAVMKQRCIWRGINVNITSCLDNDKLSLVNIDFVLLGGGSDREQEIVCQKLSTNKKQIQDYIESDGVFLAVCGGYQLLGTSYQLNDKTIPGLDILHFKTVHGKTGRCIGNIVIETDLGFKIVGFENHGGLTYLTDQKPLGKVLVGYGNDGSKQYEGVIYKNTIGTYIHGPLLPKNPQLADYMIKKALQRKGLDDTLEPLDDNYENKASSIMIERAYKENKDNPYISN